MYTYIYVSTHPLSYIYKYSNIYTDICYTYGQFIYAHFYADHK